jgi:hypothetical protein
MFTLFLSATVLFKYKLMETKTGIAFTVVRIFCEQVLCIAICSEHFLLQEQSDVMCNYAHVNAATYENVTSIYIKIILQTSLYGAALVV